MNTVNMWFLVPLMLVTDALAATIDSCPGYTASNVQQDSSSLTADLTLAGDACSVYGDDIVDLKLLVEYQSGRQLSKGNKANPT